MPIAIDKIIYQNGAGLPGVAVGAGVTLTVTSTGHIFTGAMAGSGVRAASGNATMFIDGGIHSYGTGILGEVGSHEISIGTSGVVNSSGATGIYLEGSDNTIINAGLIVGSHGTGITIDGPGGSNVVVNSGTIRSAHSNAVFTNDARISLTNSGLIEAHDDEVALYVSGNILNTAEGKITAGRGVFFQDSASSNVLVNNGTIEGKSSAGVTGSNGAESVVNNGSIVGGPLGFAIYLNGGNDVYSGQGGTITGLVDGGDGDDKLYGGDDGEWLVGGGHNDTLDGGGGSDILQGGAGNDHFLLGSDTTDSVGDTSGIDAVHSTISRSLDTWDFVESLILEGPANINGTGNAAFNSIVGNGGNNILAGQAGNDVLVGGGGADLLYGQADKDSLTGGAGNDKFVFQSVAHTATGMGDVIVDFDDNGDDLMDLSGIAGVSSFIGGAAFNAAGQVRATQVGANVLVEINTTGMSVAEGEITLLNTTLAQVDASDFLL